MKVEMRMKNVNLGVDSFLKDDGYVLQLWMGRMNSCTTH